MFDVSMVAGLPLIRVLCDEGRCPNDLACYPSAIVAVAPESDTGGRFLNDETFFVACSPECAAKLVEEYDAQDWPQFPYAVAMATMIARYGFVPFVDAEKYIEGMEAYIATGGVLNTQGQGTA